MYFLGQEANDISPVISSMPKRRRQDHDVEEEPWREAKWPSHYHQLLPPPLLADGLFPPRCGMYGISSLSDELVLRILSFLPVSNLLLVSLISRRFHKLSVDSSLWRSLYYSRFVLPRIVRMPACPGGITCHGRLQHSSGKIVWADGRRSGVVDAVSTSESELEHLCWKQQYRLRHNWDRGKCAVQEVLVTGPRDASGLEQGGGKVPVKVAGGFAVTADYWNGVRAWNLKKRRVVAQIGVENSRGEKAVPTSLALDHHQEEGISRGKMDIAVGFRDGTVGIWRLDVPSSMIVKVCSQEDFCGDGEITAVAVSWPFVLTATQSVLISLYSLAEAPAGSENVSSSALSPGKDAEAQHDASSASTHQPTLLASPKLITTLKSQMSRAPLALSIRRTPSEVIASVAYTFKTPHRCIFGIQDLIIDTRKETEAAPQVKTSRVANTAPVYCGRISVGREGINGARDASSPSSPSNPAASEPAVSGPVALRYSHPYLLATLPDNTLMLYRCTSTPTSLSIEPGKRLWGHTSRIGDAEITARGKAVSISRSGEDIRVWELEGKMFGSSVEVRPSSPPPGSPPLLAGGGGTEWVGFDDEMVTVLKEGNHGSQSLLVYDFT